MPALTPEQKLIKQQRDTLKLLQNRISGAWCFGQLKTWNDVNKFCPVNGVDLSKTLTYPDLKDFLKKQLDDLERNINGTSNLVVQPTVVQQPVSSSPRVGELSSNKEVTATATEKTIPDSWYGLHKSPNELCYLYWFQKKAIAELWQKIVKEKKRGVLVLSATGTGKTWMVGGLVRRLEDVSFQENKTWSHIPYLYVTRATVVEQTKRVLARDFKLTVEQLEVINIEQLRSRAGQLWVKEFLTIENGEEVTKWEWKKNINPCVVLWDECQALKNSSSTQHQIASAFSDLATNEAYQVFVSATPFTKVAEAKCFAVSTGKDITFINGKLSGLPKGTRLTNENWPTYASIIATDGGKTDCKPDEYNEAAVGRLMDDLEDYVVRVKGIKTQFEAKNSVEMIDFESDDEKLYYHNAWERYLKEKARLEQLQMAGSRGVGMMKLVEFLKFRMAAEYCRRNYIAREMFKIVQRGKAAGCAVNFKNTIISVVQILSNPPYNVPRDKISLIWGGGQTQLTQKQKAKAKIKEKAKQFEEMGMSVDEMLKDLDLEGVEDRVLIELDTKLRLGVQTPEDRQVEIDKFQKGISDYCFYTFRAGGVGLSLQHCDTYTKEKVRRKDSGFAVEEDIPKIPTKAREALIAPTWSPIEFIQGVGRLPRIDSLSDTIQRFCFYRGTIEERVASIANRGLRCARKIINFREPWADMILDNSNRVQEFLNKLPEDDSEDDGQILGEGEDNEA